MSYALPIAGLLGVASAAGAEVEKVLEETAGDEQTPDELDQLRKKSRQKKANGVYIYVYKMSNGFWHTSVVVYGKEYSFNMRIGVHRSEPGEPDRILACGVTNIPEAQLLKFVDSLIKLNGYTAEKYDIFNRNCVSFTSEIVRHLSNKDVPKYIRDQAGRMKHTVARGVAKCFGCSSGPSSGTSGGAAGDCSMSFGDRSVERL